MSAESANMGQPPIAIGACRFCDAGVEITRTQDGTPWHVMKASSEVCGGPEGKASTKKFIAAISAARK